MSGPGQQQSSPGSEQLDPELKAEFEELLESITKSSVKRVLERNKVKLVTKEVTSEDALQALTQKDLEEYGLSKAAAGILKLAFPTPTTAGAGGAAGGAGALGDMAAIADLLAMRVKQELGPSHEALHDEIKSWHSSQAVNASQVKPQHLSAIRRILKVAVLPDPSVDAAIVLAPNASDDSDFEWDTTPEPAQRELYMTQLTDKLQLDRNLVCKTQVRANHLLLRGLGFNLVAKSDELIAAKRFYNDPALGCVLGIELKKRLSHAARRQGEAQLYTFGLTSMFPFVQVVTDMATGGFAYWKSGEQGSLQLVNEKVLVGMGQVHDFLRQVLAALPADLGLNVDGLLVLPGAVINGSTFRVTKVQDPVLGALQVPVLDVEQGDVGNDALDDLLPWFDQDLLSLQDPPSYIS